MSDHISQHETMLKLLKKAGSKGVPNYVWPQHRILRYSQTVKTLRDDYGYDILVERQYLPNGRATSIYIYTLIQEEKKKWWQR